VQRPTASRPRSTTASRELGVAGEQLAAEFLQRMGYTILSRNWRSRHGEIDLVARDGATLVFCEVKTRRSVRFGAPAAAVGHQKRQHMRATALAWLAAHRCAASTIRFDVIGIRIPVTGAPALQHLVGAVS
jgi:putative endonuclease